MKTVFGKILFFAAIFGSVVFLGCASTVQFDNRMVSEIGGAHRIPEFQYFISAGIVLSRVGRAQEAALIGGQVVIAREIHRNYVSIRPNTPCRIIAHNVVNNEHGGQRRILRLGFEAFPGIPEADWPGLYFSTTNFNPADTSRYYLMFHNWANREILYNGNIYRVAFLDGRQITEANRPYLNIRLRERDRERVERRRAQGLRL